MEAILHQCDGATPAWKAAAARSVPEAMKADEGDLLVRAESVAYRCYRCHCCCCCCVQAVRELVWVVGLMTGAADHKKMNWYETLRATCRVRRTVQSASSKQVLNVPSSYQ